MITITCCTCEKDFNHRMPSCPFCGAEKEEHTAGKEITCPRCNCKLDQQMYRDSEVDICPQCEGIWLGTDDFRHLSSERDTFVDSNIPKKFKRAPMRDESGYLPCASCGKLMTRRNFRKISGVLIDVCREHGVWLDAGELEQIRCFIANGGLNKSQDKDIQTNKTQIEQVAGEVKDLKTLVKILHRWNPKRILLDGF